MWEYVWSGSQLTQMKKGSDTLHFTYDATGTPTTVTHKTAAGETTYYYVTNLQGDVVKIIDSTGTTVATYTYDAWGNPTNTPTGTIATLNPLRYRGYVYDTETGLYYLQSRYYNPQWGRFLNADGQLSGVGGDILGYNMFAYCMNNPVNTFDATGNWPRWITAAVAVAAAVVTVAAAATGNFAVAAVAAKVTMAAGATYIAQTAHYNRNALNNTNYTEQELIDKGYKKEPNSADKFHQNNQVGNERNRKYVIGDWFSSEIVYYSDGTINSTPEDEGTFNVYSGDCPFLNIVVHGTFDVAPYMLWGNSEDDSTTIKDRFMMIWEE